MAAESEEAEVEGEAEEMDEAELEEEAAEERVEDRSGGGEEGPTSSGRVPKEREAEALVAISGLELLLDELEREEETAVEEEEPEAAPSRIRSLLP